MYTCIYIYIHVYTCMCVYVGQPLHEAGLRHRLQEQEGAAMDSLRGSAVMSSLQKSQEFSAATARNMYNS